MEQRAQRLLSRKERGCLGNQKWSLGLGPRSRAGYGQEAGESGLGSSEGKWETLGT